MTAAGTENAPGGGRRTGIGRRRLQRAVRREGDRALIAGGLLYGFARGRGITQALRNAPVVHDRECSGCALCEEACIVRERRAIRVVTDRVGAGAAFAEARS